MRAGTGIARQVFVRVPRYDEGRETRLGECIDRRSDDVGTDARTTYPLEESRP